MTARTLTTTVLALALILVTSAASANVTPRPAPIPGPSPAPAPDTVETEQADGILGLWELASVTYNGQTEQAPAGAMHFGFDADGKVTMYYQGQPADQGEYQTQGDDLKITLDSDKVTEHSTYRVANGTLTITREIEPGQAVVITLTAANATQGN